MKRYLTVLTLVGLLSTAALAGGMKGTWTGKISDEKCGAKINADCAKKCIEGGQKAVFVNDADGKVIPVADAKTVVGHEGHHVKVTGTLDKGTLTVKKIEMVEDHEGMN